MAATNTGPTSGLSLGQSTSSPINQAPEVKPQKITTPREASTSASKSSGAPQVLPVGDPNNEIAGAVNGVSAFIDGYIRMNRRRYTAKPLDMTTGKI